MKKIIMGSIAATLMVGFLLRAVSSYGAPSNADFFGDQVSLFESAAEIDNFGAETNHVSGAGGAEGAGGTSAPREEGSYSGDATDEYEEDIDPNANYEAPGIVSQRDGSAVSNAKRCVEYAPKFEALRQKFCPEIDVPHACAIWDRENSMLLGATRGEPCPESSKGAKGCTQFIDSTAKTFGRDGDGDGIVNLQSIEDAMASTFTYLCALKNRVGEKYVYQAYQAGPKNYINPDPAKFSPTAIAYDTYIRSHARLYASALSGNMDLTSIGTVMVSVSPPIPIGSGWISAVFGEPRPHRNGVHMGADFAAPVGTPVLAIADGRVDFAGVKAGRVESRRAGIQVQLAHGDGTAGTLALSWYFHLDRVTVKTGDIVKAGQQIGTVGTSGTFSSGPHLHFQSYKWTGSSGKPALCKFPAIWFPSIAFLPNASNGRYKGPDSPGARRAAAKYKRLFNE